MGILEFKKQTSDQFILVDNLLVPGEVRIGLAGTTPLTGSTTLLDIQFQVLDDVGQAELSIHESYVNELRINNVANGAIVISELQQPAEHMRLCGSNRYNTSIAISQDSFPEARSADAVVIARGDEFADALPGGVLAYQKNDPLLLTGTNSVPSTILTEVSRVLRDNGSIYTLGGDAAVSPEVEALLSSLGS